MKLGYEQVSTVETSLRMCVKYVCLQMHAMLEISNIHIYLKVYIIGQTIALFDY